jgi:hypothetical protein
MDTLEARAMLVAIGLQESGFRYRKQKGGPARGFWQFEKSGILSVITHYATKDFLEDVCGTLVVPFCADICYGLVAYHDALACCFARLLLWSYPEKLPGEYEGEKAWRQYLDLWRPSKPRRESWLSNFERAWEIARRL